MAFMDWFLRGGSFMWFVLAGASVSSVAMFILLIRCGQSNNKVCLAIMLFFASIPLWVGVLGRHEGIVVAREAIAMADPAVRGELYELSMAYAMIPLIFGGGLSSILLLSGLLGLQFSKKRR